MIWKSDEDPFWAYLLAWFLNLLSGRFVETGREEVREQQRSAAEELRENFRANDSDDRTLDDAIDGLRDRRRRASDRDVS